MKKNNKEFEKMFMSEEISLPESLSAEKIEELINEKGSIVTPLRRKEKKGAKVIKWCASIAATIVLIAGLAFTVDEARIMINVGKQEGIINNQTVNSDYSGIESVVLNYYRDIYNSRTQSGFDMLVDSFNGFGSKFEAMDDAANESAPGMTGSASGTGSVVNGSASDGEESSHATTNTQVEGIDEADIIKNDGKYIYYLNEKKIIIADCTDNRNIKKISEIKLFEDVTEFSTFGSEMYLYDNYLAVILRETSEYENYNKDTDDVTLENGEAVVFSDTCCCVALKMDTVIKVFDISDRANPDEVFTHKITGDYVSSRVTDGKLITISHFSIPYYQIQATDFEDSCHVLKNLCIPEYSVNDGALKKIPSDRINMFDEEKPTDYTVTSIIDFENIQAEPKMNAFLGGGTDVYCTADELFVAQTVSSWWTPDDETVPTDANGEEFSIVTKIHKMNITDAGVEYINSVTVGGRCINQFSMDKNGDYFRIATNGAKYDEPTANTMVYVLDKNMKIVGFLDGIAPGEQMKSARFLGNMLYLVTFMQTDPLFTVDLSDPAKPEIKGELKIPGFSSYLHPIGNGLVIGVGAGGTETGLNGKGKISLFDVSDPAVPKELDNYTTSFAGDFITDHKAFVVIDENTFAIPFNTYGVAESVIVFSIEKNGIIIDNSFDCLTGSHGYGTTRGTFIDKVFYTVNVNGIIAYDMETKDKLSEMKF